MLVLAFRVALSCGIIFNKPFKNKPSQRQAKHSRGSLKFSEALTCQAAHNMASGSDVTQQLSDAAEEPAAIPEATLCNTVGHTYGNTLSS